MRRVKYYEYIKDPEKAYAERTFVGEAVFHQFGVNYEEHETGPGNYSTAIIELDDGKVLNHPVEDIEFIKDNKA